MGRPSALLIDTAANDVICGDHYKIILVCSQSAQSCTTVQTHQCSSGFFLKPELRHPGMKFESSQRGLPT